MGANILTSNSENWGTPATEAGNLPLQPFDTALYGIRVSTANLTNVASSATTVLILAINQYRNGAVFYNDSSAICYLAYAATASTSSYTVQIPSQGTHTLPGPDLYRGAVSAIWASANGNLRITEY